MMVSFRPLTNQITRGARCGQLSSSCGDSRRRPPERKVMRRSSIRDFFERNPAILLAIAGLAMAGLAALSVKRLDHARATVHGNWALSLTIGVGASLAVIGSTSGWMWRAYR